MFRPVGAMRECMKSARKTQNLNTPTKPPVNTSTFWRRRLILALIPVFVSGVVIADWWFGIPEGTQASYVGGKSCIECHAKQHAEWRGSYHDQAMDRATSETV